MLDSVAPVLSSGTSSADTQAALQRQIALLLGDMRAVAANLPSRDELLADRPHQGELRSTLDEKDREWRIGVDYTLLDEHPINVKKVS